MTIEADLRAAAARADADSRLLHEIVHGDAATTVDTEGGPVKSVAKAIGDVETGVAGAAAAVAQGVAAAEAARDQAIAARDAAQAAGVDLASDAETESGTGDGVVQARQLGLRTASQDRSGLVVLATDAEGIAGQDRTRAMTPAADKAALDAALAGGVSWAPVLAVNNNGARRVLRIVDWTGGVGVAPAGGYLGPSGIVATAAAATDIRGPRGSVGPQGPQGPQWSPDSDDDDDE